MKSMPQQDCPKGMLTREKTEEIIKCIKKKTNWKPSPHITSGRFINNNINKDGYISAAFVFNRIEDELNTPRLHIKHLLNEANISWSDEYYTKTDPRSVVSVDDANNIVKSLSPHVIWNMVSTPGPCIKEPFFVAHLSLKFFWDFLERKSFKSREYLKKCLETNNIPYPNED